MPCTGSRGKGCGRSLPPGRLNVPLGLILLALMGIGPAIAWRKASARSLTRNLLLPVGFGSAVGLVLHGVGVRHLYALLTFAIGAFALTIIAVEFWKGTRARARIGGEGHLTAFLHLVGGDRRRWGGYVVHVGLVVMFMGFAGSAFDHEVRRSLLPGESVTAESPFGHDYTLTNQGLSTATRAGTCGG